MTVKHARRLITLAYFEQLIIFFGFSRFDGAVKIVIYLILAFWRTYTAELLPGLFGCILPYGLGPNYFLILFGLTNELL